MQLLRILAFTMMAFLCSHSYAFLKPNLQDTSLVTTTITQLSHLESREKMDTLLAIGQSWVEAYDFEDAIALFKAVIVIAEEQNDPRSIALSLAGIGSTFTERKKMADSAQYYYHQAWGYADQGDDVSLKVVVLRGLGIAYLNSNDYGQALVYLRKALEENRRSPKSIETGKTLYSLGTVYLKVGEYHKALELFLESMAIEKKAGTQQGLATLMNSIAHTYLELKIFDQSRAYLMKAITIYDSLGLKAKVGRLYGNMGILCTLDENFETAIEYYIKSIAIAKTFENKHSEAIGYLNISDSYIDLARYNQADSTLALTLDFAKQDNNRYLLTKAYTLLGRNSTKKGNYDQALDYYQKAMVLAKQLNLSKEIGSLYLHLSKLSHKTDDMDTAYEYLLQNKAWEDSLLNEERVRAISQMEARYDLKAKAMENEQLRVASEWKEQQIAHLGRWLGLLAFLLVLILLLYIKIRKVNQKLNQTNDRLKGALETVEDQKTQLVSSNRTKEQFFSIIAHDFKRPLNALQALITNLNLTRENNDPEQTQFFNTILEDINAVNNLFNNLLYWALQQKDELVYKPQPIDLAVIIKENLDVLKPLAKAKSIEVNWHISGNTLVESDVNMLSFIIRNLLDNAIKYTPEHGEIDIWSTNKADVLGIHIDDNGIGMEPEQVKNLFESNTVHATEHALQQQGTGLGLMLSYQFAKKAGGRLSVQSKPGEGSVFTLRIPLRKGARNGKDIIRNNQLATN